MHLHRTSCLTLDPVAVCKLLFDKKMSLQAGHAVHEDQHQRSAEVIANFIQRFRIGQPKMVIPKASGAGPPVLPIVAGPADKT